MELKKLAYALPVAGLLTLGLTGCGSSDSSTSLAASSSEASTSQSSDSSQASDTTIYMYVFRGKTHIMGPDNKGHDTVVPATFVVHAGQQETLKVTNYDEGPHTITNPDLGINLVIKPGQENADKSVTPVETTLTFTVDKAGVYRWYCTTPCDAGQGGWAMGSDWDGPGKNGFMAGYIVVI